MIGEFAKDMYDDRLRVFVRPPSWMYHQHILYRILECMKLNDVFARRVLSFAV